MRKKCNDCNFIAFAADEICKRCNSSNLIVISNSDTSQDNLSTPKHQSSLNTLIKYFCFALLAEIVALALTFPIFVAGGMRHSSNAPTSGFEIFFGLLAFIVHIPTIFVTYLLTYTGFPFIEFTPITQILFWMYYFYRRNNRN